jgi:superfamily I DNA/RNA helicase
MAPSVCAELLREWETFKREEARELPVYEHDDYVDLAIEHNLVPDVDVLFIDEFQDLSPQQYLLYKRWRDSGAIDRIYIAGDVNQSIYKFRGARKVYLAETPADEQSALTESYRCPAAVVSVARGILDGAPGTDPNGFTAGRPGGTVTHQRLDTDAAVAGTVRGACQDHDADPETGTSAFVLARTNRRVGSVVSALREQGVPYLRLGMDRSRQAWTDDLTLAFGALAAVGRGDRVTVRGVRTLLDHMNTQDAESREFLLGGGSGDPEDDLGLMFTDMDPDDVFSAEDVARAFPEDPVDLVDELTGFKTWRRDVLAAAVASGVDPRPPRRVRVGTMHAAKGLEAPAVLLLDSYTARLRDRYYADENGAQAAEHRLYYVGATRASETLHVVSGFGGGEQFPPLRGDLPRADVGEVTPDE